MKRYNDWNASVERAESGLRYACQQKCIEEVAAELGCVVFRPDYHRKKSDANTVLLYLAEDAAHNRKVDALTDRGYSRDEAKLYHIGDDRYIYRDYFWSFENTDVNGRFNMDFANHGRLDLRSFTWWETTLEGAIKLAFYTKMQNVYTASVGGLLGIREADEVYNDFNRKRIDACLKKWNASCFLVRINAGRDESIFKPYLGEKPVPNFGCDFCVPVVDEKLKQMIQSWRGILPTFGSITVKDITDRAEAIGGENFVWY